MLVNTARRPVIDEAALTEALANGRIAAAVNPILDFLKRKTPIRENLANSAVSDRLSDRAEAKV